MTVDSPSEEIDNAGERSVRGSNLLHLPALTAGFQDSVTLRIYHYSRAAELAKLPLLRFSN